MADSLFRRQNVSAAVHNSIYLSGNIGTYQVSLFSEIIIFPHFSNGCFISIFIIFASPLLKHAHLLEMFASHMHQIKRFQVTFKKKNWVEVSLPRPYPDTFLTSPSIFGAAWSMNRSSSSINFQFGSIGCLLPFQKYSESWSDAVQVRYDYFFHLLCNNPSSIRLATPLKVTAGADWGLRDPGC